jgi:N utilization substance protein A
VVARDGNIDPVGACVGVRGARVQAVVNELQGEKIDIVPWSGDVATFLVNALSPAQVAKVVMDDATQKVDVVVPEDQLSLAIGRRGQNVRLAAMLTGWNIDIMTEEVEAEKRATETQRRTSLFMEALDVDDVFAHLLIAEGFSTVDDLAYIDFDELTAIEGFEPEIAQELQSRALAFVTARNKVIADKLKNLGITDELQAHAAFTVEQVIKLGEEGVKTLDDLGELAGDELQEILGEDVITLDKANEIIMAIREKWFAAENVNNENAA